MTQRPDETDGPRGTLRPTGARTLLVWFAVGAVGGWLLHPVTERVLGSAPLITWAQPGALLVVALVVGWTAWSTWRVLRVHRDLLENHQAVNRFVLARSAALVGALVGGGYLGYALSWVGDPAALADQRMWRSAAAGVAGLLVVVAALLLERACRVRSDDDEA